MFKRNNLFTIGVMISLLFSSCEQTQEPLEISSDQLPTIEVSNLSFLRGASSITILINENELVSINDVQLSVNDKTLFYESSREGNQWQFTLDSKQLEDGLHDFKFDAQISSELNLPQSFITKNVVIEVDNFLPTYTIEEGLIAGLDYENSVSKRENSEKSIIFFDKEHNAISEVYNLSVFSGEITIPIPENNQDQTFYISEADYSKVTIFTKNAEIDSVDIYTNVTFTAISSSTTEINSTSFKKEQETALPITKIVTVGYPTSLDSLIDKSFNYVDAYEIDTLNNIIYTTFDIVVENKDYNLPFYFIARELESDNKVIVLTSMMSDQDTFLINENNFNTLDAQVSYSVSPMDTQKFTQIVEVGDKKFYFDAIKKSKKGKTTTENYIVNFANLNSYRISYSIHHARYFENTISLKTTTIDQLGDSFAGLYSPSLIKFTSENGVASIIGNKAIEGDYFSEASLTFENTLDSITYNKVNVRFNTLLKNVLVEADFTSFPTLFSTFNDSKFSALNNFITFNPTFSYYKTGNILDDEYFRIVYYDLPIVEEESAARINGPYSLQGIIHKEVEKERKELMARYGVLHYSN